MKIKSITLLSTFIFALTTYAQTDLCQRKYQYSSSDEIRYRSPSSQSSQLRYFQPHSHRSKPNDKITIAEHTYTAWGDLGLVKYSHEHQQIVDEIPLERLTSSSFRGELLALDYHDEHNQLHLLVFNDRKLRFEKIRYCLAQKKALAKVDCPS